MFGLINNCKQINDISICENKNLVNIVNSTCISNLLKSQIASCNIISGQHIPAIEEITQGIILLNSFNGTLQAESTSRNITGTFLIRYDNTNITINDRKFSSEKVISTHTILPAILQPSPIEKEYHSILSLEMMHELHINNTKEIQLLQSEKETQMITTYGSITFMGILFIIVIILKLFHKRRNNTKVIIQQHEMKNIHIPPESNAAPKPTPTHPQTKFNDIPYF